MSLTNLTETGLTDPIVKDTLKPSVLEHQRGALRELLRLIAERSEGESSTKARGEATRKAADASYQTSKAEHLERYTARLNEVRLQDEERRRTVIDSSVRGEEEAKRVFGSASRRLAANYENAREKAKLDTQRGRAEIAARAEAEDRKAQAAFAEGLKPIDQAMKLVEPIKQRLDLTYQKYKLFGLAEPKTTASRQRFESDDPSGAFLDRITKAKPDLELLEALYLPRLLHGNRSLWLFPLLALPLVGLALKFTDPMMGIPLALLIAGLLTYWLRQQLFLLAAAQVNRLYHPLNQTTLDLVTMADSFRAQATERLKTERNRIAQQKEKDLVQLQKTEAETIAAREAQRDERLREINQVFATRKTDLQARQQIEMRDAVAAHEQAERDARTSFDSMNERLEERYATLKQRIQGQENEAWQNLIQRWREGIAEVTSTLEAVRAEVECAGPAWTDPSWPTRPFPTAIPPVLRLGEIPIRLADLPQGLPTDPRLMEGIPDTFTFFAARAFPETANLLVEANGKAGAEAASHALQAAMLRLLTSLPPGQVRFTILDPNGIGRGFGAFMHLADFDEALVNQQVWTEPRQVEDRLAELSTHMEKVAQRYLRNEYASIEEYNAVAEEVAEPYRVVVVSGFPSGFDEKSAARLANIAASGPPCGVLTLISLDGDRPLPDGFPLESLRKHASVLTWKEDRLVWDDPDLCVYPLALDSPPPAELATKLITHTGAAAKDASRVEVPFEFIAPKPEDWWTLNSRGGIEIPLGKAGATKRQYLSLGRGTSQHVLLAGRTGSGKSTLLHALITNLVLNYSPDEVDLYLIDFKKGVEFKVYATQELPHASVVAIESEREFGISVLHKLDAIMKERADTFRDAGVQDLNGYREVQGAPPMPRILLVVDEFQEFFVEEDKLAQEAALLLDRLVRQGRAFGVHVHLGSQSLGGAYALARTTLGQMAIRIALQCSDSDAALILNEQNTAARLLSRPGEAVYNDANGLSEGNHFFQVVWLSDQRREAYLKQVRELAKERPPRLVRTPLVFEGGSEADLTRNARLTALAAQADWPASPRSALAWMGEPMAIKEPTGALFRRQGGNHLLVVGQNEESARGIMTAALLSLAVQFPLPDAGTPRSGAAFFVLDGTPDDHPQTEELSRLAQRLPHTVQAGTWRDAGRIVAEVAREVERRQQPGETDGPELFLFVHDLPRFRDLRKRENDYGFSRRDEEATPADHFANIIREGSGVGVHILTWCDNLNNLNRYLDHQGLREFELRILFQMSANDSGHLLDSPAASRLGPHRALFSSEEQNRLEKFRPYGLPDQPWLDHTLATLQARAGHNSTTSP